MEINPTIAKMMHHFITERHTIYKLKAAGQPAPWTSDPILQTAKFTNVRRELDRESRNYIQHIARNPALSYEEKLANTILFRIWNKWESMERLGGPWKLHELTPDLIPTANEIIDRTKDYTNWFTNAFMVSGVMTGLKVKGAGNVLTITRYFPDLIPAIVSADTPEKVFKALNSINGLGDFLCFQIYVDFTYIRKFPFTEDEFVVPGPGSRRGIDLLLTKRTLPYPEALKWIQANLPRVWVELGLEWNPEELFSDRPKNRRTMTLATWQNCFCELSKYNRITNGGKPKVYYDKGGK